ncbi:MAG TPA: hypothetical protein VEC39_16830, partial [Vicinamibacterales bacterium]|nr:hypothetical protein [Vicinamibacterales bacterium]
MAHLRDFRYGGQARLLIVVMAAASLTACASSGIVYTPQPFPQPGGRGGTTAIPAPADPGAPPVAANPPGNPPS